MIDVGPFIKQGAPPHGPHILGEGRRTIGQAGCLLSCLVMAARALTPNRSLTVLGAHDLIEDADGFVSSALRLPAACKALGMILESRETYGERPFLTDIANHRPVILGIDYKPGHSSGFSDADHFVICIDADPLMAQVIDPATGTLVTLDLRETVYRNKPADICEMIRISGLKQ